MTRLADDETGEHFGYVKFVGDRTAEHEAGLRLRASEALLRNVMENNADCLKLLTPGGRLTFINGPGIAMLEIGGLQDVRGREWASFWPEEERSKAEAALAEAAAGRVGRFQGFCPTAKGAPKWWDVQVTAVPGSGGQPELLLVSSRDVTERRRAETELRRLNEHLEVEVSRRAEQLRRQEEALRQSQKLEAVGQLTGGVAHDFNNLLTVIRSSADLLRRPDLPEERRRRYVEAISDTANRAAKLTGQLLAFARRQPLKPEVFAVGERVQAVAELVRPLVGARVAVETAIECAGCAVEADPTQFETALVNLAVNARDAMGGEGRLALETWPASEVPPTRGHEGTRGAFVAVSVSDTGSGIGPETMGRIFEPFFTTKEVGKGTGLGLPQVYGFAKQSGGELHVETEVGRGTTFTLYLPLIEAKPVVTPPRVEEQVDAPASGRKAVLLVEDNTRVGEFAKQMLEDLGHAATWAPNAKAALRLLEEDAGRFDVVFSDVVMPGMNGVELGEEIRRRYPGLPVILTSGYSHVLANGGTQGFELLCKPYSVEGLSRALRSNSRGPAGPG